MMIQMQQQPEEMLQVRRSNGSPVDKETKIINVTVLSTIKLPKHKRAERSLSTEAERQKSMTKTDLKTFKPNLPPPPQTCIQLEKA